MEKKESQGIPSSRKHFCIRKEQIKIQSPNDKKVLLHDTNNSGAVGIPRPSSNHAFIQSSGSNSELGELLRKTSQEIAQQKFDPLSLKVIKKAPSQFGPGISVGQGPMQKSLSFETLGEEVSDKMVSKQEYGLYKTSWLNPMTTVSLKSQSDSITNKFEPVKRSALASGGYSKRDRVTQDILLDNFYVRESSKSPSSNSTKYKQFGNSTGNRIKNISTEEDSHASSHGHSKHYLSRNLAISIPSEFRTAPKQKLLTVGFSPAHDPGCQTFSFSFQKRSTNSNQHSSAMKKEDHCTLTNQKEGGRQQLFSTSPVRADTSKAVNIDEILKNLSFLQSNQTKQKSHRMDFQEYLEQELKVPKAAAVKQTTPKVVDQPRKIKLPSAKAKAQLSRNKMKSLNKTATSNF